MARIKRFVLNLIAFIFTTFLSLKFVVSLFFVYAFGKLPLKVCQNLRKINEGVCTKIKDENVKNHMKTQRGRQEKQLKVQNLFQCILDSCISLCLTATLVNYNSLLVEFTFLICHKIHHSFLSLIYQDIPDFTKEIQNLYSYFLVWAFILCGFLGITTQMAFIMDLISILTLPTKLIYTVLRWIYSRSIRLIGILYEFIRTDQTKWITCPYSKKYLTSNYRTVALMLLIVIGQVTAFTVFYYAWLSVVIVGLVVVQVLSFFGYWLCVVKKYQTSKQDKSLKHILNPILEPETAIKVIKGTNVFENVNIQEFQFAEKDTIFSFFAIFRTFSTLGQNSQTK